MTFDTSSICSHLLGSICAEQPVTTIFALGFSFLIFLILCLAFLSASDVTAQVLNIKVFLSIEC